MDIAEWHEYANANLVGGGTVYSSSGSTGPSKSLLYTPEVFQGAARRTRRLFEMVDLRPGYRVAICWGYGLFPPAQFYTTALSKMGCAVLPLGSGKNLPTEIKIRLLRDTPVQVLVGMPSYLLKMAQDMQSQSALKIVASKLKFLITGGEPLDPGLRASLEKLYGVPVFDHYGMLQAPMIAGECTQQAMHISKEYFPEVLREDKSVTFEGDGILLLSSVKAWRPIVLVRLNTRDLVSLVRKTCACGSVLPSITVRGRADFIMKVRGQQIDFPALFEQLRNLGIEDYYFEIKRNPTDSLVLHHADIVDGQVMRTLLSDVLSIAFELSPEKDFQPAQTDTGKVKRIIIT